MDISTVALLNTDPLPGFHCDADSLDSAGSRRRRVGLAEGDGEENAAPRASIRTPIPAFPHEGGKSSIFRQLARLRWAACGRIYVGRDVERHAALTPALSQREWETSRTPQARSARGFHPQPDLPPSWGKEFGFDTDLENSSVLACTGGNF